ncbi:MAG: peptide-methionine (S)-S-oxide reductase [Bdellovibrionales bacterium CG10_big_fil_rev_8_21_14_0_10_45_34]|nr:MAG: peptide-methionine (S)-S-oxide reductase [Bdellovibrionales bacterium CG10_big_fil_rev_8_21_14_0_10_45_34]
MSDSKTRESVVLAGGCFWGVEELIRKQPGVLDTIVGYTGGTTENPRYDDVKTGKTGHAEAIKIEFDPSKTGLDELLKFFFKIHDPTTINRQGNDIGSQYRSAIFFATPEQEKVAKKVIDEINKSGTWKKPLVTKLEKLKHFYPAEEDHQDYLQKNPDGYTCHFIR